MLPEQSGWPLRLEAEKEADKGNYAAAQLRMEAVFQWVKARGHVGVAKAAENMAFILLNSSDYAGNAGYCRSFAIGGARGYGVSHMGAQANQVLTSCNVAFSNSAMNQMSQ